MANTERKISKLYETWRNLQTGTITLVPTSWYQFTEKTDKTNTVRRVKPTDLFANGTSYLASTIQFEDGRYIRSPSTFPGNEVWSPIQIDFGGAAFVAYSPSYSAIESRLRSKIKSMSANLAQNVAEYRQASSMFAGLAGNIISTFRSLRSGRLLADFVRILQQPRSKTELAIANRWLQYQYGLKPLMNDLYETSDALAKGIRNGMYLHVRSSMSDGLNYRFLSGEQNPVDVSIRTRVNGVARYKISDPSMKMLSQFGITNPLLLAWELIPYSFVIDWMFPVGNFLTSLDALNGTSDLRVITSSWETHRYEYRGRYGGVGVTNAIRYKRNATNSSLSLPKLGYKPSSSLTAVANGLALLTQLRHR